VKPRGISTRLLPGFGQPLGGGPALPFFQKTVVNYGSVITPANPNVEARIFCNMARGLIGGVTSAGTHEPVGEQEGV
jgi:hypothetical protein